MGVRDQFKSKDILDQFENLFRELGFRDSDSSFLQNTNNLEILIFRQIGLVELVLTHTGTILLNLDEDNGNFHLVNFIALVYFITVAGRISFVLQNYFC